MPKGSKGRTLVEKLCEACGKPFIVNKGLEHVRSCSQACGYVLRGRSNRKGVARTCGLCGKSFFARKDDERYCSKRCEQRAATTRPCEVCGNPFRTPPSQLHVRTCSTKCGYILSGGQNKPNYKGASYRTVIDGKKVTRLNTWAINAYNAVRSRAKKEATPKWANKEKIQWFYREARRLTEASGMPYHVDHIVPLNSRKVCGLHNEFNLEVIPARINLQKHNRTWPDMP